MRSVVTTQHHATVERPYATGILPGSQMQATTPVRSTENCFGLLDDAMFPYCAWQPLTRGLLVMLVANHDSDRAQGPHNAFSWLREMLRERVHVPKADRKQFDVLAADLWPFEVNHADASRMLIGIILREWASNR
jgi:hypothetical protein